MAFRCKDVVLLGMRLRARAWGEAGGPFRTFAEELECHRQRARGEDEGQSVFYGEDRDICPQALGEALSGWERRTVQ